MFTGSEVHSSISTLSFSIFFCQIRKEVYPARIKHLIPIFRTFDGPYDTLTLVTRIHLDPRAFCLLRLFKSVTAGDKRETLSSLLLQRSYDVSGKTHVSVKSDLVSGELSNMPDTGATAWWMQIPCTSVNWKLKTCELKPRKPISLWELLALNEKLS